ncbi:hypothetical protein FSARC_3529 [Fusarium sarcochroum]|uniref:Uncharacterized protein n=1 Tax=Fusarium sarcochroum TaxID=1208366 RepID=A0A8H4XCJ4_9HYPO|nr:hypothetical protein FSARC_3529 [Fusarium sarcochroum]
MLANSKATDVDGIKKFVADAALLVDNLGVVPYKDIINSIRSGVDKLIDDVSRDERLVREQREEDLAHIAEERAKLYECEESVKAKTCKKLDKCQSSAGLGVQRLLDEAEKESRIK